MRTKHCHRCDRHRPLSEFSRCRGKSDGRQHWCKLCMSSYVAESRRQDPLNSWASTAFNSAKSRAKRARREFNICRDFLLDLWAEQDGKCAMTGTDMTISLGDGRCSTSVSVDRINSNGGYIPGNVRLVCDRVNTMKSDMSDIELMWWCRKIVEADMANMDSVADCEDSI